MGVSHTIASGRIRHQLHQTSSALATDRPSAEVRFLIHHAIDQVRVNAVTITVRANQLIYLLVSRTPCNIGVLGVYYAGVGDPSERRGLRGSNFFFDTFYFRPSLSHRAIALLNLAARH